MRLLRGCALGDCIILLGAAVVMAKRLGALRFLSSPYCQNSVQDCLQHHPEIEVFTYEDDLDPGRLSLFDSAGNSLLQSLGRSPALWYHELGLSYEERFVSCPISRVTDSIPPDPCAPPVFVHDDLSRGLMIPVCGYRPPKTKSILDHVPAIKGAQEIHCIDSSFFHFVESMDSVKAALFHHTGPKLPYSDIRNRHNWIVVS